MGFRSWDERTQSRNILHHIKKLHNGCLPKDVKPLAGLLYHKLTIIPEITKDLNKTERKAFLDWAARKGNIVEYEYEVQRWETLSNTTYKVQCYELHTKFFNTFLSGAIKEAVDSYSKIVWLDL